MEVYFPINDSLTIYIKKHNKLFYCNWALDTLSLHDGTLSSSYKKLNIEILLKTKKDNFRFITKYRLQREIIKKWLETEIEGLI